MPGKKIIIKTCLQCGEPYEKKPKFSISQWNQNKFCSPRCSGANKKINDGITKGERHRRKINMIKQHTPEWLEKIRVTTKDAMQRPETKEKMALKRKPMTDEGKIIRSDALMGKMPKNMVTGNNGSFPNVQNGEYECSKGSVYFRSKWEANYALYLDFLVKNKQIKDWEFEPDVFVFEKIKFGTRSYCPDFKIFNNNGTTEYHEVKGYMDARSKTKLKRMGIYFPSVKLLLIQRENYNAIYKQLKTVLNMY